MAKSVHSSLEALLQQARLAHEAISRVDPSAALASALDAGDALLAIKAQLHRGEWTAALASIGIPASSARLYMQLARNRDRIVAAGCASIREARRLLAGTRPRARTHSTSGTRGRPATDRYDEGYADGYRAGRADGYQTGYQAGQATTRRRDTPPTAAAALPFDIKDLRWLITKAHPDKNPDDLRATRVTQVLNELLEKARKRTAA
jgi:hypothetical protein